MQFQIIILRSAAVGIDLKAHSITFFSGNKQKPKITVAAIRKHQLTTNMFNLFFSQSKIKMSLLQPE